MPPRISWQTSRSIQKSRSSITNPSVCLLCRFHNLKAPRKAPSWSRASQSRQYTHASPATPLPRSAAIYGQNSKLHNALTELQKTAGSYVNLSKLQLALRGLEQGPGKEVIRVAVMGIAGKQDSLATVKKLLRLVLADPLKEEQEWERILLNENIDVPVLLRFGADEIEGNRIQNNLFPAVYIHSPALAEHRLEILVLEIDSDTDDDILVPTIEIPTSSTGRYTPVTTPVHKALIVGDGLLDAAAITELSEWYQPDLVGTALNLPGYPLNENSSVPFKLIDIDKGASALSSIRLNVENAINYEHNWFQSGLPSLLTWLKSSTSILSPTTIKVPVHNLISSVLNSTLHTVQAEQNSLSTQTHVSKIPASVLQSLRKDLDTWAERAHTELRDELEIAFRGHRWRKLSWYKLFWRVDDVSQISQSILSQRFLVSSQQELIYLCGKLDQAGVFSLLSQHQNISNASSKDWAFMGKDEDDVAGGLGSQPPQPRIMDLIDVKVPEDIDTTLSRGKSEPKADSGSKWPIHIPATRTYLIGDTVPALQALAQKLVLQSLGTSGISVFLAGLLYVEGMGLGMISGGTGVWGLYEVGAVAALGVVWGLRGLQRGWEGGTKWGRKVVGGRQYWEEEVEEVGRRCIGSVVSEMQGALKLVESDIALDKGEIEKELLRAVEAVEKAKVALSELESGTGKELGE